MKLGNTRKRGGSPALGVRSHSADHIRDRFTSHVERTVVIRKSLLGCTMGTKPSPRGAHRNTPTDSFHEPVWKAAATRRHGRHGPPGEV